MDFVIYPWTTMDLFLFWPTFFVCIGIFGTATFGLDDGPDYSAEVEGKVLDTSLNRWMSPIDYEYESWFVIDELPKSIYSQLRP